MVPGLLCGYLGKLDEAPMARLVVAPTLGADAGPLGAILLAESGLDIIAADDLTDAAQKAVAV